MDNIEVNTMQIDGKEFFEVDLLESKDKKNKYDFFAEVSNPKNIRVYKVVVVDGEEYLEDIRGVELVEAFKLFNDKYR